MEGTGAVVQHRGSGRRLVHLSRVSRPWRDVGGWSGAEGATRMIQVGSGGRVHLADEDDDGVGAVLSPAQVCLRGKPRVHLFGVPSGLQVNDRPLRERLESRVVGIHVGLIHGLTDERT